MHTFPCPFSHTLANAIAPGYGMPLSDAAIMRAIRPIAPAHAKCSAVPARVRCAMILGNPGRAFSALCTAHRQACAGGSTLARKRMAAWIVEACARITTRTCPAWEAAHVLLADCRCLVPHDCRRGTWGWSLLEAVKRLDTLPV
jgi:hypothetical protein